MNTRMEKVAEDVALTTVVKKVDFGNKTRVSLP